MGFGGVFAVRAPLTRQFFGKGSFGTIFGMVISTALIISIVGPVTAGWIFDTWGNYQGVWFVLSALAMTAVISVWTTPQVPSASEESHEI